MVYLVKGPCSFMVQWRRRGKEVIVQCIVRHISKSFPEERECHPDPGRSLEISGSSLKTVTNRGGQA